MSEPSGRVVRHAEWELPEVLVAVILLAFTLIAATALVTGLVAAYGQEQPGLTSAQIVGLSMQDATTWANPAFTALLLGVVVLVWWQVRIWTAEIAQHDTDDPADAAGADDDATLLAAFDHLLRAKSLASWAVPVVIVLMAAAADSAVASFLLYRGPGIGGGTIWSNHTQNLGLAMATWVLAGAALVAALYLRAQVIWEFAAAEEAAEEERVAHVAATSVETGHEPSADALSEAASASDAGGASHAGTPDPVTGPADGTDAGMPSPEETAPTGDAAEGADGP
jgi:hypothetical protein